MIKSKDKRGSAKIVRFIGIAFLSVVVVLISVFAFSYIRINQFQHDYQTKVKGRYQSLELVNDLFSNKEITHNLLRKHIYANSATERDSIYTLFIAAHDRNTQTLFTLDSLVKHPQHRPLLHQLIEQRRAYYVSADSLLNLNNLNQPDQAKLYLRQTVEPVYAKHQSLLIKLSEYITASSRKQSNDALEVFTSFMKEYFYLLILGLISVLMAGFLLRKVFKEIYSENLLLNKEIEERKLLQNSLIENQNQYKALFNNNPVPLITFDQTSLKITEVNQAAINEYGYTFSEFCNLTILDIKPHDQRDILLQKLSNQQNKRNVLIDKGTFHMRKDGSIFEVEVYSHPLPENRGVSARLVVAMNVNDHVKALKELQKREQQLTEVSSSIPGAVYQFRVSADNEFSFPYASAGIKNLYGFSQEDLYQNPNRIFEHLHQDDITTVYESIEKSVTEVSTWYNEARLWNPEENKWKWVRGHSQPSVKEDGSILFNGTLIDITPLKEAQEELSRSEANLQALLNSAPQAIFLLDEKLQIISFNKVAIEYIKEFFQTELIAGQNIADFLNEEHISDLKQDHGLAMNGQEVIFETGMFSKWCEVSYRPAVSKDNRVLAVALSIKDITDQRNILETIKKSEAQLAKAHELAKIGSWEFDLKTKKLTGSEALLKIYEIEPTPDLDPEKLLLQLFTQKHLSASKKHFERALSNNQKLSFEHKVQLPNGKLKYMNTIGEIVLNSEGQPVRIIGATQDITALKITEQEATEAKEKFKATLENIPEIIISLDNDFNIQYISPQVQDITGYTEHELVGSAKNWGQIVHPDDFSKLRQQVLPEVLSGKKAMCELRIVTKSGETKWLMCRHSPSFDKHGNINRIDSSAADITDKKQEEAQRTLLTEQLQNQNQHLQQFAYIVSHNLRAPIANIMGLTSIFNHRRTDQAFSNKIINNLSKSATLLDDVIRDLNEILTVRSQLNSKPLESVYLQEVLKSVLSSAIVELKNHNIKVEYDFSHAPVISSIKSYIYSILQNLIMNSIKYRTNERVPEINLRSLELNDYIYLEVSDNGIGIDLTVNEEKIFGLYKRFHPQIEGKGLGLHLVKTQIELLGGKIDVESKVNVGTTFKIYLKK